MATNLRGVAAVVDAKADFRTMYKQMPQILVIHPSRVVEICEAVKKMEAEAAKEFGNGTPHFSTHAHGKIQTLVLGMKIDIDHGFRPDQGEVRVPPDQKLEFTL